MLCSFFSVFFLFRGFNGFARCKRLGWTKSECTKKESSRSQFPLGYWSMYINYKVDPLYTTIVIKGAKNDNNRWWFQISFIFSPILEEMIQFDEHIFSDGLKPPTSINGLIHRQLGLCYAPSQADFTLPIDRSIDRLGGSPWSLIINTMID